MADTWSGWAQQFLNRAGILVTPPNLDFMHAWAQHAPGDCKNNPVDLSRAVTGSSRCGDTVAGFGRSQNYGSHAEAAHAFQLSIDTTWVRPLKQALNSGNPFQIGDRSQVVAVLKRWGSVPFATWYASATIDGTGNGGDGGSAKGPHVHKGYTDLRRSVNQRMPRSIRHSRRLMQAALRSLGHGRKVR